MSAETLKNAVRSLARSQGYDVTKATQGRRDMRLELVRDGTKATLICHCLEGEARSWAQFARLDVGTHDGPPTRWGVVEGGAGVQVALGATWTSVCSGFHPARYPSAKRIQRLEPLFVVANKLWPGAEGDAEIAREGDWPLRALEDVRLRPTRYLAPTGGGLLATGTAATVATVTLGGLAASLLWMPAVVATVVGGAMLGTAAFSRLALLRSLASGRETHQVLRTSGAFTDVDPVASGTAENLWVLIRQRSGYLAGKAKGATALFGAQSKEPMLQARVRIDRVSWPTDTLPLCRVIPDCWATVELTGAPEALALAPSWHRTIARGERIGWLFDGDELAAGKLADVVTRLATSLRAAQSGPYR